jgi:hypothetical protein
MSFNYTFRSETEVLKEVTNWLANTYVHGIQLAGVLCMLNTASPSFTNTQMRNLQVFEKLVGEEQLSNVTIVTNELYAVGSFRTLEGVRRHLGETNHMWRAMLDRGVTIEPFDGTPEGAQNILRKILLKGRRTVLNIQREMVDQELDLSETAAGKLIREAIRKLQVQHTQDVIELRSQMKESLDSKDTRLSQMLIKQQRELSRQLASCQDQIAELEAHNSTLEELRKAHHEHKRRLKGVFQKWLQVVGEQNAPPPPSYDEIQSYSRTLGQASRQDASVALSSPGRSLLASSVKWIRKLLRPIVPLGYRRLEWTCVSHFPPPIATCMRSHSRLAVNLSTVISKKRRRDLLNYLPPN